MISKRASGFTPFIVMDIMAKAEEMERKGEHIIHMEVGEPDFPTPKAVIDAAVVALKNNKTRYTHALGLLELRQAICDFYLREYGVSISPDQVLISTGTSPVLLFAMLALLDHGDEVIVSNPRYPCYQNFILAAGGRLREIQTYPEEGFQYRHQDIAKKLSRRTKGIMINSPCNPTGIVMSREQLQDIARFDAPYIISDEIYHGLVYRDRAHSILEFTDRAFVINGFSKLYAMTGWRLGYLIFPKKFSAVMQRIHQNFMISANGFIQWAGIAALRVGSPLYAVGAAVEDSLAAAGERAGREYGIVEDYVGHGIGTSMHMDPQVPNYRVSGKGPTVPEGLTIAIEPMICQGDYKIKQLSDGWTVKTKDGGLAAHFEHSIAILKDRTEIMTRSWDDPDFDPATFSLK